MCERGRGGLPCPRQPCPRRISASTKPDTTRGMAQAFTGRRDFLKTAGAAALTSSIFTGNLKGANDKVNIGFIGVGAMGSGNIGYAAKVPGFQDRKSVV